MTIGGGRNRQEEAGNLEEAEAAWREFRIFMSVPADGSRNGF
jgi:hypothetical protein